MSAALGTVRLHDEPFTLFGIDYQDGLYHVTLDKEGNEILQYVGEPLKVTACGRDPSGCGWGSKVKWHSPDGFPRETFIPRYQLLGEGREALARLMDGGYCFELGKRQHVLNYLNRQSPKETLTRVAKLGWIEDMPVYMLADGPVGATNGDRYEYTGEQPLVSEVSGTLEEWQQEVAKPCVGNSRLLLCAALAFAGPLLRPANQSSFGLHLVGPSSIGKSTAMRVAASVSGDPAHKIQTWNATKVGLETTAGQYNDSTLFLDEMGQADPAILGETVYMLANGEGKTRANADLSRRAKLQWRTTFLSNGEIDLQHSLESVGRQHKAGHDVRMLSLQADAGQNLGIFETLHGFVDGAALSKHLGERTSRYHGRAMRAFIERLVQDMDEANAFIGQHRDEMATRLGVRNCDGQVQRAADALCLISAAGELASRYGVTGWPAGAVSDAVVQAFQSWLHTRGTRGSLEEAEIIQRLVDLLQGKRGQLLMEHNSSVPSREIYGFTQGQNLSLYTHGFKQLFAGFQQSQVLNVLEKLGILLSGQGDKRPRPKQKRVHVLAIEHIYTVYDALFSEDGES